MQQNETEVSNTPIVGENNIRSSEQDFDFHFLFLPAKSPENGLFCLIFHQILRFGGFFVSLDEFVHI